MANAMIIIIHKADRWLLKAESFVDNLLDFSPK
jgi:hypothetical protein